MKLSLFLFASILSLLTHTVFAQQKDVAVESAFLGNNIVPVKLSVPDYPKKAREVGLGGRISVDVTLDKSGHVVSAENIEGPYPICQNVADVNVLELRTAVAKAAMKSRFKFVAESNDTISASGRLVYIFTPPFVLELRKVTGARVEPDNMTMTLGEVVDPNPSANGNRDASANATSKSGSDGLLNGKAISIPAPKYPSAARAVRASGSVEVRILIFEDGTVYSAEAVSGHPLLRRSSELAACQARFSPTVLSGNPVKVSAMITYNYVP